MSWLTGRKREIGILAVVAVVALVVAGCQGTRSTTTVSRAGKMRGAVISQLSADTAGPAVGRGGGGRSRHGDWASLETRGILVMSNITDEEGMRCDLTDGGLGTDSIEDIPAIDVADLALESEPGASDEPWDPMEIDDPGPRPGEMVSGSDMFDVVYFDFDEAEIRQDQLQRIRRNADWLKQHPEVTLNLEGHCDERGTEAYNLALSEERAKAVRNSLAGLGIDPSRLSLVSFGESNPCDPGHDEGAWSINRRVEFVPHSTEVSQASSIDFGAEM